MTPWTQSAAFPGGDGREGRIDIAYLEEKPAAHEGPFLREERSLIESLAQMLASFFERQTADEKAANAFNDLERQVRDRTADLERVNQTLREEIAERRKAEEAIRRSQDQLRRLAIQLTLAEERERRAIAEDLHDHIGQAQAVIRVRLRELQSNAVFSGMEDHIEEMIALLDRTIRSTRTMTFEISPPILYDLGLEPALNWLCGEFREKHGLRVEMTSDGEGTPVPDAVRITVFRSVQEFLMNAVKHAPAAAVRVHLERRPGNLRIEVRDDGPGFDVARAEAAAADHGGFGLFSIRERMTVLGGRLEIASSPGHGASFILSAPVTENEPAGGKS